MNDNPTLLTSATIQQWEEAGVSLANALARYLKLSDFLDKHSHPGDGYVNDLVARIDSSLQILHTTLEPQLTHTRVTLAKTRNKLISPIHYLPEEILCRILMIAVFDRDGGSGMSHCMRVISRRLHAILGVCTVWRNICISRQAFWSIIPILNPHINLNAPLPFPVRLSLQRASHRGLHLVISLLGRDQHAQNSFASLREYFPRFCSLNAHSDSANLICSALTRLIAYGVPEDVSHLSLCYADTRYTLPIRHGLTFDGRISPRFTRLMASLSVLRISGVLFDWNEISPSRLVEFHVSRIAISGVPAIDSFLNLLASMPELRHLELIGVRVISYMDPDQSADIRVSFPKLKSLYLEDLYPGVMALFLTSIAPGSYRVTVNLSNTSIWKHQTADIFLVNTDEMYDSAHADVASMCNSLAPFPIDQLILGIHPPTWTTKFGLHTLLKSVPKLKSLVLNNFELHNEFVEALLPPPASEGNEGEILFPRLETVEFRSAVLIDRLERLKDVIAHHPVQCLVLGGVVRVLDVGVGDSPLEGGEEIVQWLKARVPGFRLIQGRVDTADSTDMGWQLWDI